MTEANVRIPADGDPVQPLWEAFERKIAYLAPADRARVAAAFELARASHATQRRKSGEPYITHPLAVADLLADMHIDADALAAALLHDTLEDCAHTLSHADIERDFGADVAGLVQGVTKLEKLDYQSRQEANAESFRKMMLAVSRDLRVILIKLADRLHNMRTLGSMASEARRRIARETLDIYAPIAQRLGMNAIKAELQNRAFVAHYPWRNRVLEANLKKRYTDRREGMSDIHAAIAAKLAQLDVKARLVSRMKSAYSIYTKMKVDRKTLDDVLDVYGVRVVVDDTPRCYLALGAVHGLYKPVDGRFRDFIAIPKPNGYQSLHTVLVGPHGVNIEVQIRTEDMDYLAERGIAAHWSYKADGAVGNSAQSRAREWVAGLVDAQTHTDSSMDFVEHVKVDLCPDDVIVFTPKGKVVTLPRNATALDFAYAVHTQLGNHAVAARVDKKLVPLRTRLVSGQTVEIIRAESAQPQIGWLDFVVSSKARLAIRHALKQTQHEESISIGYRLLDRAMEALGCSIEQLPAATLEAYLQAQRLRRLEDLFAEIALGNRMPQQVATALTRGITAPSGASSSSTEKVLITGSERGVVSFANCCYPLPGEAVVGYLSAGKGIVVHREECPNLQELRKHPERIVAIDWDTQVSGDFKVGLRLVVENRPGVLAVVAATIAECKSNIDTVEYQERDLHTAAILFTIEVKGRKELAVVIRGLRRLAVVKSVARNDG